MPKKKLKKKPQPKKKRSVDDYFVYIKCPKVNPVEQPMPKANSSVPIADLVIQDIKARKAKGMNQYGVPLQANNGRNSLLDLYEELLDAVQYLKQHLEEDK